MKIYIVFNNSDLNHIKNIVTLNDLVIGDVNSDIQLLCRVIKPSLSITEEEKLIEIISSFFNNASIGYFSHIKAFSNNLYEATLRPIASYLIFLQNMCKSFSDSRINIEVIFPSRIIDSIETSAFFLAEHETQRMFLYSRQFIFQPYLERFCRIHQIPIGFVRRQSLSLTFLTLPIRRFTLLFFRFCRSGVRIIQKCLIGNQHPKLNKFVDIVAITRLARKSEFLEPILTSPEVNVELVVAENFISNNSNWGFCTKYFNNNVFNIKRILNPDISFFFLTYFRSFLNQFYIKGNFNIDVAGININCKNALLELLISYPDVLLYINSLNKTIETSKISSQPILLSTELKSPHAYADAFVAKSLGYSCVHIMDCDLPYRPLPSPIFGDLLVTNTNYAKKVLMQVWKAEWKKILFLGSLLKMKMKPRVMSVNKNIWCFFTCSILEEDVLIIEKIIEMKAKYDIDFIIKLHPRDSLKNYKKYKDIRFVTDDQISRNDLFNLFDYGLTFSSAVIHDLMIYKKPFLLVKKIKEPMFNIDVHIDRYQKLVINEHEIIDSIILKERFINYFNEYNREYLNDIFMTGDSSSFLNKLIYWQKYNFKITY